MDNSRAMTRAIPGDELRNHRPELRVLHPLQSVKSLLETAVRIRNVSPVRLALATLDLLLHKLCPDDAAQLGLNERVLLVAVQLCK